MNTSFRMFPDSDAAKGRRESDKQALEQTPDQIAFQQLLRGVHF